MDFQAIYRSCFSDVTDTFCTIVLRNRNANHLKGSCCLQHNQMSKVAYTHGNRCIFAADQGLRSNLETCPPDSKADQNKHCLP